MKLGNFTYLFSIIIVTGVVLLLLNREVTWRDSIAVGDSASDIAMLEAVEQSIAFNPEDKLLEHAVKKRWPIIIERKNVIYKLEPHGKKYILA